MEDITCNTVGFPLGGLDAKIIDENENIVNWGETGEVCTKGFHVFQGYVKDEEKTKESFTQDGYFKTGDLGAFNENGTLR